MATQKDIYKDIKNTKHIILCEPIPFDIQKLRNSPDYAHVRMIRIGQMLLNKQIQQVGVPGRVQMHMVSRTSDIPKCFHNLTGQICCLIFGSHFLTLSEPMLRLQASCSRDRFVVVCHSAGREDLSYEKLSILESKLGIKACNDGLSHDEQKAFWTQFFSHQLGPLIVSGIRMAKEDIEAQDRILSPQEIQNIISRDQETMDALPAFPHITQQAIKAIAESKNHIEIAKIIEPDGTLQAHIIRTSNLTRYGSRNRIESLPNAIAIIGVEELKRILMSRAVHELVLKVQQAGFNIIDFFCHSTGVGYLAQMLSINYEHSSVQEQEILRDLNLKPYVLEVLKEFRLWEKFKIEGSFEAFTAGILHDLGKVVSTICYDDIFPLILYQIERSRWEESLLESEIAVVGDFQHPVTGGALMERWEIFPHLIEPIRQHHQIHAASSAGEMLIASANVLIKGLYPFPKQISIPALYRQKHLSPQLPEAALGNPVFTLFESLAAAFERGKQNLNLSSRELETGTYAPENVQALLETARQATDAVGEAYLCALVQQNPEFSDIAEIIGVPQNDLITIMLFLKDTLKNAVYGLLGHSR